MQEAPAALLYLAVVAGRDQRLKPQNSKAINPKDLDFNSGGVVCRKHLLQLRWYSLRWYLVGKLHCAYSIAETLRSLPIYESATSAAATAAALAAAEPPGEKLPGKSSGRDTTGARAAGAPTAAGAGAVVPARKAAGSSTATERSEDGPPQPVWLDLSGPRFLAPAGIPPAALTNSFVAADSAAVENVLMELLGVQRISQAEAYRCTDLGFMFHPKPSTVRWSCSVCNASARQRPTGARISLSRPPCHIEGLCFTLNPQQADRGIPVRTPPPAVSQRMAWAEPTMVPAQPQ